MSPDSEPPASLYADGDLATLSLRVPADYEHCQGHFPGDPLVPGVTQIAWGLRAVEGLAGAPLPPHRIARFKFRLPIRPGAAIVATARRDGARFELSIAADGQPAASGTLIFLP